MTAVAVALAGGLGAACRFLIEHWLHGSVDDELGGWWPRGTLTVNVSGSLLLGLVVGLDLAPPAATVLAVGFLGGYTTFSTYAVEVVVLAQRPARAAAAAYALVSVIAGVAAACLGLWVGSLGAGSARPG